MIKTFTLPAYSILKWVKLRVLTLTTKKGVNKVDNLELNKLVEKKLEIIFKNLKEIITLDIKSKDWTRNAEFWNFKEDIIEKYVVRLLLKKYYHKPKIKELNKVDNLEIENIIIKSVKETLDIFINNIKWKAYKKAFQIDWELDLKNNNISKADTEDYIKRDIKVIVGNLIRKRWINFNH